VTSVSAFSLSLRHLLFPLLPQSPLRPVLAHSRVFPWQSGVASYSTSLFVVLWCVVPLPPVAVLTGHWGVAQWRRSTVPRSQLLPIWPLEGQTTRRQWGRVRCDSRKAERSNAVVQMAEEAMTQERGGLQSLGKEGRRFCLSSDDAHSRHLEFIMASSSHSVITKGRQFHLKPYCHFSGWHCHFSGFQGVMGREENGLSEIFTS
jgi:hypothetical protein